MGHLAKTKGTPVMSSKSATHLGLAAGAAGPLPLQGPAPGAAESANTPAAPAVIVTCSTSSKK